MPLPYPALGAVETDAPLAVLIDENVNSAAEGLAGVLQSTGRARIFGETSAGNVEAVLPFCLRDGSQAWIATGVLAPLRGPTWRSASSSRTNPRVVPLETPSSTCAAAMPALNLSLNAWKGCLAFYPAEPDIAAL